ncbi:MAG: error-prone DNA polymerase [Hyphomicrobiaceae bacterium]|nr:error-prone DNA polymerase [Hyphomicrobiaceae bacterium]
MTYAELDAISNFSFLEGASHPQEMVDQAKALGLTALVIADRNTLAGIVRAHVAAKSAGLQFIPGARLDLVDAPSLICLPRNRAAYGRLARLLSLGQSRAVKGQCHLTLADVADHAEGQIFILKPPTDLDTRSSDAAAMLARDVARVADTLGRDRVNLAATCLMTGVDPHRFTLLAEAAATAGIPLVATNAARYHAPHRRPLADVVTCIRHGLTITNVGFALDANAERHLKPPAVMATMFHAYPEAIARTVEIAAACHFSLDELVYEYPDEPVPAGVTPDQHLAALTFEGAQSRYPDGLPEPVAKQLRHELDLISQMRYAPYFLTVHDIVRFARSQGILCQGRGSAANSAVCYCLGITAVNPVEIDLLFERFITPERREPPDIDVDFEHERREEVIQYIYARYGRDRAGLAAAVISYRGRSALREVGKAMGLSEDTVTALAGMVWGAQSKGTLPEKYIREAGLDPSDPLLAATIELADELTGFPRHLSQHVGGFVLTRGPLIEVVPVGNAGMADRTFIEWDKDDLAALGLLKVDILALGMLTCIHRAFDFIASAYGRTLTLATVPREDAAVYDMLCRADSIGVFQVESRAQMNMLPRLRPRTFYDLVIEVAIVRPGPIQGDMVHPYLRRRQGIEPEYYPEPSPEHGSKDELRNILSKTKGVPLFQEQAMKIAMVAAKFSDAEVNELRKSMATFRKRGTIGLLEDKMISRMVERGYDPIFAARCFNQIKGFGEYGFPESHAASFALLVYVSSWLKCHYPDVFAAALLNSQPMGFYAPAQIVRDAREHGVEVRPVDITHSRFDCTLEPVAGASRPALRLGLNQVDGLATKEIEKLDALHCRRSPPGNGPPFISIAAFQRDSGIRRVTLEKLADADAFRSLGLDRRQALWEVHALDDAAALPLFAWSETADTGPEPEVDLAPMALSEHVVADYQTLRLSLKAHPLSFLRTRLSSYGRGASRVVEAAALRDLRDGSRIAVAGVVLVRQRPGSAKGVVFMTIEDETGVANAVVWPKTLERYRRVVMGARLIVIHGRIQRQQDIIHVVSEHLEDRSDWLSLLADGAEDMPIPIANGDEVVHAGPGDRRGGRREARDAGAQPSRSPPPRPRPLHPRGERTIPKSRDFH